MQWANKRIKKLRRNLVALCVGVGSALLIALALWPSASPERGKQDDSPALAGGQPAATVPSLQGAAPLHGNLDQARWPTVHVRDAERHGALDGAAVRILPREPGHAVHGTDAFTATANESGLVDVPQEMWEEDRPWVFSADGYRPTTALPSALLARAVNGAVTVDLGRGFRVSGHVVTPWGTAVPDAEVVGYGRYGADFDGTESVLVPGPEQSGEVFRSRSDAQGAYQLSGIAGFPIRMRASKAGFAWSTDPEQELLLVDGETDQVRLVLRPRLVAGVRVVDEPTGEIVRDFHVQMKASDGPVTGWAEASAMHPGSIPELGFPYRDGEWWLTCSWDDSATDGNVSASAAAIVSAPGYASADDVGLVLRPLDPASLPSPSIVKLTPTELAGRGLLRVQVLNAVPATRLPWANIRVEQQDVAAEHAAQALAWTFRMDQTRTGAQAAR